MKLNIPDRYPQLVGSEKQISYGNECRRKWLRAANDLAREIAAAPADEAKMAMEILQAIVDAAMADESAKAWIERESALASMKAEISRRGLA